MLMELIDLPSPLIRPLSPDISHGPKRLKKDWDSSSSSSWSPLYGGGSLDQEAIQYIHKFYCKDCRMEEQAKAAAAAASGGDPGGGEGVEEPTSPQSSLEEMSLQQSMDKNKESLKRKLMMRRSVNELVDQGIYPSLKTPPAFAEQRKHLERAKTGDLLRHKIQQRPDRQVLVQQHILEDTKIDPSLHDRQRKLKRARIADDLNDKLSHRPGPLELIKGNILQTDNETFKTALQDGSITFSRTFDEDDAKHFVFDEDGTISDTAPSPSHDGDSSLSDIGSPPIIPPAPETPLAFQFKQRITVPSSSIPISSGISTALSKLSPITTQSFSITNTAPVNSQGLSISSKVGSSQSSNLSKNNRIKKPKPKTQPKTKVIKFHEYKGPPNIVKTQTASGVGPPSAPGPNQDTPYHILLQQQQLFLQWQLEFQSKNLNMPVTLVPAEQSEPQISHQPPQPPAQITLQPQSSAVTQVVMTSSVTTSPTTVTSQPILQGQPTLTNPIQTVVPQTLIGKSGIATVVKKPSGQTIIQTHAKSLGQPKPQMNAQTQLQVHTPSPNQIQQPLQGQPQVQKTTIVKSVSTPLLNSKNSNQNAAKSMQQSAKATSQTNILKPLTNLEEMKVPDLRAELKKRNLTVSGVKTQLIERLKPYMDVIIPPASSSANTSSAVSAVSKLPVHAVVNVKSMTSSSSANEITMTSTSPPQSPKCSDKLMNPMSPEVMDTAPSTSVLTAQMKDILNPTQTAIPMSVDTSRPPSVNPDMAMDVDNSLDLSGSFVSLSKNLTSPPATTTTITFVTSQRQAPVQQIQIVQPKVVSISPTAQIAQPKVVYTSPGTQIAPPSLMCSSPVNSVPQPTVVPSSPENMVNHEDILQQQRLKIEQLQRQLEESQKRLKQQQMQHHHLQEQQKQLNQLQQQSIMLQQQQPSPQDQVQQQTVLIQQPTSPPQLKQQSLLVQQTNSPQQLKQQPKSPPTLQVLSKPVTPPHVHASPTSPPQTLQTMTVSVSADGKISPVSQSLLKNAKFVPVAPPTMNVVQNSSKSQPVSITGLPITSQGDVSSVVVTKASDKAVKTNSDFFKTHSLQPNVNIVKPMTSLVNPNAVTFQQPMKKTVTLSPVNGVVQNSKPLSLPSSPVDNKNLILRTSSTPFFIPMREPPKYDEAIRNKINQGQSVLIGDMNKVKTPATKSQAMDDVLEILIRNGELPPSAAQEPPPTPKTLSQTGGIPASATVTTATITSNVCTSSPVQFSLFSTNNNIVTTTTVSSSSTVSDVNALLNNPVPTPNPFIKKESDTPPPPPPLIMNEPVSNDSIDLPDFNEMLNRDLSSMDWADDPTFLDLTDTTCMQTDQDVKSALLTVPSSENSNLSNSHGSEPDLAALGINDPENTNMQMDVSDWLDVIMPSTGLTPLSANAPVSFPSDPILTPKTQQEVLDLFNFEEADFGSSTEFQGGLNWEKLTETTTT